MSIEEQKQQIANEIDLAIGTAWQAKVDATVLTKAKTSSLVAALGSTDNLVAFIELGHVQQFVHTRLAGKAEPTPEDMAFMEMISQQLSQIMMFTVERISAEVDRRFPIP